MIRRLQPVWCGRGNFQPASGKRLPEPSKLQAGNWKLETGSGKLEAGSWKLQAACKLETGSWKLQAACKLETGNWKLEAGSWKLEAYSYLSASIGSSRDALIAGNRPKKMPTLAEKPIPSANDHQGSDTGKPEK